MLAAIAGLAMGGPCAADVTPPAAPAPQKSAREVLDARYVFGPSAADMFGYRIVWQTEPLVTKGASMQVTNPSSDSVWFGDSAGSVVRLRRDSGELVWRSSTYQGLERMISIDHLPQGTTDRVYVITDINCIALDAASGALVRRTSFSQLPSTEPTVFGPYMLFGTRSGQLGWYQYGTGYNWRATTIGGSVSARVTVHGDVALAGSSKGTVLAMEAGNTRVIWTRKLAAGIEAPIAADDQAAFVASRDQSLWAFDMQRGRVLWQYFTQTPLVNEPVRIADGLYLQIPDQGLVSFNPHPAEKPDGEVRWKSKAAGNVIGRLGTNLLVWDRPSRTLATVDVGNGRVVEQRALPQVNTIMSVPRVNGDLYIASEDGRVERVEPLVRPTMTEETGVTVKAVPSLRLKKDGAEEKPAAEKPVEEKPAAAPEAPAGGEGMHGLPAAAPAAAPTGQPLNPRLR